MKRVCLIHTGGTFGMNLNGSPDDLDHFLKVLKERAARIFEISEVGLEILFNKDSSNMCPEDWQTIAEKLNSLRDDWDGFVVTHGTDTMTFTATAISYFLVGFGKPIIFTGSQLPLADSRSDGPRNIIHSFEIASEGKFHEVGIFFDDILIRANRAKKVSISTYDAFESPNLMPIAKVGVSVEYQPTLTTPKNIRYSKDTRIDSRVLSLNIFPGFDSALMDSVFESGIAGIVLNAFGPGDIPNKDQTVLNLLKNARKKNIPVVICSQAIYGAVDLNLYETGRAALKEGAISSMDMTWEAALVKIMVLLGRQYQGDAFKKAFLSDLAGEISKEVSLETIQ